MISARASTIVGTAAFPGSPFARYRFGLLFFVELGIRGVVGLEKVSQEVAKIGVKVRLPPIRGFRVQQRFSSRGNGHPNKSSHEGEELVSSLVSEDSLRCDDTHRKHGP